MNLNVNGYIITDLDMAINLYETGRLNKRTFKKVKNYLDALTRKTRHREPEDLEAAWDNPGLDNDWSMGKLLDH